MKPDLRDALVFGGLALVGAGAWMIYPPAALIVSGTILLILGVWGAL